MPNLTFPLFFLQLSNRRNILTFINVAIVTALCLLLPVTRIYGVIGVGILLYFRPVLSLAVLALAGITYFAYKRFFA